MPFLFNIPQATDQLSISQGNILNNFTILGAIAGNLGASSAAINATSGFNWIYLPNNGSTPPAGSAFPAGDIALYASLFATTAQNELYINKRNQATVVQIPATASILSTNSAPTIANSGWSYLPSGILLRWGVVTGGSGTATVTLGGAGIPAFNQILNVQVTPYNTTAGDINFAARLISIISTTQFSVYLSSRTSTGACTAGIGGFTYLVIGY